jgi:hypothetical protein
MTNAPTSSPSTESFFQVWVKALTKPSETTFAEIAASPRAKASTAYLWIFLCTFAPAIVSVLVNAGPFSRQLGEALQQAGVNAGGFGSGVGASLIGLLCVTPFVAVFAVIGFIISVALMQWIARMFKGQGTFDQLAYSLGAITAPGALVSALITLPSAIPFVGLCMLPLSVLFSIYLVVLQAMSIKGVHRFGWGATIGTMLIPGLAITLLLCCAIVPIFGLMGLGPTIGNVFSTINQSLGQ